MSGLLGSSLGHAVNPEADCDPVTRHEILNLTTVNAARACFGDAHRSAINPVVF